MPSPAPTPRARRRAQRWLTRLLACAAIAATTSAPASGEIRLHIEGAHGGYEVWADNPFAGPMEVMLHSDRGDVVGDPALPARATVPAHARVLVARVHRLPGAGDGGLGLRLDSVPGSVNARPLDYEYLFPLHGIAPRVEQAWGGGHSHADPENLRAVDFAAPIGTTVLAARDGVVMQVEVEATAASAASSGHGRANLVRILHDDGSMAVYAHLQRGGALVRPGQRVRRGQPIALSGNSGASAGPHLHFAVQANRGMHLESLRFRMWAPGGILRFSEPPAEGD